MGFIQRLKRLLRFKRDKDELIAVVLLLKRPAVLTDAMLHATSNEHRSDAEVAVEKVEDLDIHSHSNAEYLTLN